MKKSILLLLSFQTLIFLQVLFAQDLNWVYSYSGTIGSSKPIDRNIHVAEEDGYIYTFGSFFDSVDFDFSSSTNYCCNSTSPFNSLFLQKLDKNGTPIWTHVLNEPSIFFNPRNLTVTNGKIHLSGTSSGNFDIDPSPSQFLIQYKGNDDDNQFVAQFDTSGVFEWCVNLNSDGSNGMREHVVSQSGNVLIYGSTNSLVDIHPSATDNHFINAVSGATVFYMVKLDFQGELLWIKDSNPNYFQSVQRLNIDQNENVVVHGFFIDSLDFDLSNNTDVQGAQGFHDYMLKVDVNGDFVFGRIFSFNSSYFPFSNGKIEVDSHGDIYLVRPSHGSHNCSPDAQPPVIVSSNGGVDLFLIKYDGTTGDYIWHGLFGGINDDWINNLQIDNFNNVHVAGRVSSNQIDLDPSASSFNVSTNGDSNFSTAYIRLNSNGEFLDGGLFDDDDGSSTLSDFALLSNKLIFSGTFENSVDFDPESGDRTINAFADEDNWIASYGSCSQGQRTFSSIFVEQCSSYLSPSGKTISTSGVYLDTIANHLGCDSVITLDLTIGGVSGDTIEVSACNEYVSPSGEVYDSSGEYTDTLISSAGCDSLITIFLTIPEIDLTIISNNELFIASQNDAMYQWLDCENNFSEILGANSQSFEPSQGGYFAVEITYQNCKDTSECDTSTLNILELEDIFFIVYPNPYAEEFHIKNDVPSNMILKFEIFDLHGRLIQFGRIQENKKFGKNLNSGAYVLKVFDESTSTQIFTQKIFKR